MSYNLLPQTGIRPELSRHYRFDEQTIVQNLLEQARCDEHADDIKKLTTQLVGKVRTARKAASGVDALMHEFSLSSQEGVALMCLAEALLRIPDKATADKLIRDKIAKGDWRSHTGNSPSLFVNAAAWGLVITGKLVSTHSESSLSSALSRLISKGGEPLIRKGVDVAMRMLGKQFVTGETIQEAIKNGEKRFAMGYRYSYDMLGEAAFTAEDAKRYYADYVASIHAVGATSKGLGVYKSSGVSVKLSAIHPRYSLAQHQRVMDELYPRLKDLFLLAKKYDIGLNIDAEEADRLELSLDLMDKLLADPDLAGFNGVGFVVQAYQKRCPYVIEHLIETARKHNRQLMIRLVKGAYWDTEIKRVQTDGAEGYPVFSRKVHTDLNYIVCAKKLLAAQDVIYPQFATHNAQTLATIYHLAQGKRFEFQCLHGMGESLYDQVVGEGNLNVQCRIYAPVGTYQTLLAYLVRRLLENGANSSFVSQIVDENLSIDDLAQDPVQKATPTNGTMHPKIPLPVALFGDARPNSKGYDLTDAISLQNLENALNELAKQHYQAAPQLANGTASGQESRKIYNPANVNELVGEVVDASEVDVANAFDAAAAFQTEWANTSPAVRAECLEKMADLMEANMPQLFDLAVREAGKTLNNAIAEVREAVDFCRYYAKEVRHNLDAYRNPRGIVVAISPWNFPLAIFVGEVSSALVAGNVVLAKPAEQTSLMAHYAVSLFHQAGVPKAALQCLPGSGKVVGAAFVADPRVNGVIFTGSTDTAKNINRSLHKTHSVLNAGSASGPDRGEQASEPSLRIKNANIVPLVAETGGQNAMIVDSSALGEQVVADVLNSAFDSAGQRCSALRVLYLQRDVADHILTMLKGAMTELKVGRPQNLTTDIGPVIDKVAQQRLLGHIENIKKSAKSCYQVAIEPEIAENGIFVPPTVLEIDHISQLKHEVFGPVLHVIRFDADKLDQVIADINSTGFGLTSGLHSRIDETVDRWLAGIHAGNLYVNRNTVGAVVGVQPFGGMGLSGTGPKAGGPLYLQRLVNRNEWTLNGLEGNAQAVNFDLNFAIRKVLSGTEQQTALDLITNLARRSPLGKTYPMQGITGEKNEMTFVARPQIAIGKGSLSEQVQALIAIVTVGSQAVVEKSGELAKHTATFAEVLKVVDDFNHLDHLSLMIVLDPLSVEETSHYANRQGVILTYIDGLDLALSLLPLVHEKAISINTAAAGGNASLMSEMD